MNHNFNNLTDRELLLLIANNQENLLDQHKQLVAKVSNIESKIIEDIETRLRNLENDSYERRGAYKFWIFFIGLLSVLSMVLTIYKSMKF